MGDEHIREPDVQGIGGVDLGSGEAKKQTRIQSALSIASQVGFPEWVSVDEKKMVGILKQVPAREDILPDINENLVVELYSK